MKNTLNKINASSCRNVLVSALCLSAIGGNAFSAQPDYLKATQFNSDLVKASNQQNSGKVVKLLENAGSINSTSAANGATPLMEAAMNGNVSLVKTLINRGALVNIKDLRGETALQYAIRSNNMDVAQVLVESGADTKFLGAQEASLRKYLAENANSGSSSYILPKEYKQMYVANSGVTSFGDLVVNAADKGDLKEIKRLVASGHSVNSTGSFNTTPLMRASYRGHQNVMKYLIENGAKVNMTDSAGMTALSLAKLGNQTKAQTFLVASGANPALYATFEPAAFPFAVPAITALIPGIGGVSATTIAAAVGGTAVAAGGVVAIANNTGTDSTPRSAGTGTGTGGGTGGGDDGGDDDTPPIDSPLTSAELASTGAGVTVAIIGNGVQKTGTYTYVSHADGATHSVDIDTESSLASVWDVNSTDFDTPGPLADDDTGANDGTPERSGVMGGHDTETALIINQIASDSNILSVRAFDADGTILNPKTIHDAINYASDKGAHIINNSWGLVGATVVDMRVHGVEALARDNLTGSELDEDGAPIGDSYKVVDSIKDAIIDNDVVMVWAAGNNSRNDPNITAGLYLIDPDLNQNTTGTTGTANPEIASHWLVASAVEEVSDGNYIITSSNKCGLTQARCLVSVANSTSHSAAQVTGAVAKLLASSDDMTPTQAANRVLRTAYYLNEDGKTVNASGTPVTIASGNAVMSSSLTSTDTNGASNAIYGHGLLNPDLNSAEEPYGSLFANTSVGGSSLLSGSSVRLGKAFGDALANSGTSIVAFDKGGDTFGSAKFSVKLDSLVSRNTSNLDLDEAISRLGNSAFQTTQEYENGKLEYTPYSTEKTKYQIISPEDASKDTNGSFSYTTNIDHSSYAINHNVKMDQAFGFGAISAPDVAMSVSDASHKNPYLGFATEGFSAVMKTDLIKDVAIRFGAFNGQEKNMYDNVMSKGKDVAGTVADAAFSFKDTSVGVQVGTILEKGAFLGTETTGIFATDGATPTNFIGISAQNKLTDNFNLFGYYVAGRSTPTAGENTLFSGISDITSSAFSLGVSYDGFAQKGTSVGFAVAQPLRIDSGTASFAYDAGKSVNLSLAPSGREMDIESYYHMQLGTSASTTISSMYRINPDNIATNEDESITLIKFQNKF